MTIYWEIDKWMNKFIGKENRTARASALIAQGYINPGGVVLGK